MMKVNQRDVLPSTCRSPMNGQISSIQHFLIMRITVMRTCIHSTRSVVLHDPKYLQALTSAMYSSNFYLPLLSNFVPEKLSITVGGLIEVP